MSNFATFIVAALLTLGVGLFVLLLFAGVVEHWRWSRRKSKGRGGYLL